MSFAVIQSRFFGMTYKNPSRNIPVNVIFCLRFVLRDQTVVVLQVNTMVSAWSTESPRQCFGAPDRLGERYNGLGKYEPIGIGRHKTMISVPRLLTPVPMPKLTVLMQCAVLGCLKFQKAFIGTH